MSDELTAMEDAGAASAAAAAGGGDAGAAAARGGSGSAAAAAAGGGAGGSNGSAGGSGSSSAQAVSQAADEEASSPPGSPPPPLPPPPAASPAAGQAKDAAALFQSQRYAECLQILEQLYQKKENDPKVVHNIAVAEYYRDGCTDPQRLLEVLANVKGRSEELARAEEEQLNGFGTAILNSQPASSSSGSRSSAAPSGVGSQEQSAPSSGLGLVGDAIVYMEDYDVSIATLNTAVIYYHLQQYATALSVLEPLYENIEPIDETAALRVCMLMLDITLASGQPGKAANVLQTMEKSFGYLLSPGEGGNNIQHQPLIQTQLLHTTGVGLTTGEGNNGPSSGGSSSLINSPSGEAGLTRTTSQEILDEETLSLSLDVEGPHGDTTVGSLPLPPGLSRVSNVEKVLPAPAIDLKLMLQLYKVRLLMLTRNLRATKREVKAALNLSRDHLMALVLKAQLEYSRANYRKAIKLLTTWSSRADPGMKALFLSNLGCIHHRLRKDHTAAVFFRKALQANASQSSESPSRLSTFSQDKSLSILYNAGLQQLICGNPFLAARCLQEAACLYYNQPLLWVRLAECCILAHDKKGQSSTGGESLAGKREEIKVSVIGDGKWRRVVLPTGSLNAAEPNGLSTEADGEEQSNLEGSSPRNGEEPFIPGIPHKLSLSFARDCLHMALQLLDRRDAKAAEVAALVSMEVNDGEEPNVGQNQKTGTSEKKGSASGGSSSQVSPNGEGNEGKILGGTSGIIAAATAAYDEERRKNLHLIRQCVVADLAYVELCLMNPLQALRMASDLLTQPECTQLYAFLGRLYAAEALCLLDRSREAADYLSVCLMENSALEGTNGVEDDALKWKSGDNSEASGDGEDSSSVSPYGLASGALPDASNVGKVTGPRARAALYVNLSAVYVMQGDLAQAHQWATQAVTLTPANPLAVLAVVYVNLLRGQREEAVNMLKHCRHLCVVSPNKVFWQKD